MHYEGSELKWLNKWQEIEKLILDVPYDKIFEVYREIEKDFMEAGLYEDYIRNMCLADRFFLLVIALNCPPANHPWIYARMREVQKDPDDHLDLWPRSHFKSTSITFAGTIQEILRNPDITVCIFSHSKQLSKQFLDQIKQVFEGNMLLKSVFPDILYENPQRDSKRWSVDKGIMVKRSPSNNKKEPTLSASGVVDGQPTGAHFELRVYDDLVTAESVSTPEQVEKTTAMLALSQNLGNTTGVSRAWYIGTRYSYGDTYQDMIDKGSVKVRKYAATEDGTLDGKPVFMTQDQWDSWKLPQTTATLNCQMMQNPLATNSAMFSVEHLRPYEIRPNVLNVYILVDPASSMKKGSDKTAILVIGVDSQRNKFLLDGVHHKINLKQTWDALSALHKKWSQKDGVVEVYVGYERYGMQRDIEHFQTQMETTGYYFPIEELNTPKTGGAGKIDRMYRLEPDVRMGKIYLPAIVCKNSYNHLWRSKKNAGPDEDVLEFMRLLNPHTKKEIRGTELMLKHPLFACSAIKRKDEGGRVYDVSLDFIEQLKMIPFAKHDDIVDCFSRIYDMDLFPPSSIALRENSKQSRLDDYSE